MICNVIKYSSGYEIEKNGIGGACNMYAEEEGLIQVFDGGT